MGKYSSLYFNRNYSSGVAGEYCCDGVFTKGY